MKPPRRRNYNLSRIKKGQPYSIDEVARLWTVSKGTVHHWLKDGLTTIDRKRPFLIHGGDLFEFHKSRQANRKQPCQAGEIYCFKCRVPRHPAGLMVDVEFRNQLRAQIAGLCAVCLTAMNRVSSVANLAENLQPYDQVTLLNPRLIERLPPSLNCYLKDQPTP